MKPAKRSPNPIDKHVGSRVRMRRKMLGLSQEKLGDALQPPVSFQQVQREGDQSNQREPLAAANPYPAGARGILL